MAYAADRRAATGPPRRAADTEVIRRLEEEWVELARSRLLRTRLQAWAANQVGFEDGSGLIREAQRRDPASWSERDRVLAALLELGRSDPLARRVALQVVLPGVTYLIDSVRGWDTEERAARVVSAAVEVLDRCASQPAQSNPSFRVFANTRRRVLRAAIRDRSEPVVPVASPERIVDPMSSGLAGDGTAPTVDELVDWVQSRGGLGADTARAVVLTRTGEASVEEMADALGVSPDTLRHRRLRAEQQLREVANLER
jgi:DNA-directed RNA polymerase specialized sigma24 family protein